MKKRCDLHTHSCFSDGTFTPTQLIRLAEEAGLAAVALCDHNTVAGLGEFVASGRESTVEAVPGIEFSTEYRGRELHILGLFIQEQHYEAVNDLLAQALERKKQSNMRLLEKLREQGVAVDYESLWAEAGGTVNRAVIGAWLVRHGCCGSMEEAFDRWLNLDRGFYVPPKRPGAFEIIRFIKSIGAVAVLAHPFLNLDEAQLRQFLEQATELDGMEVYYSKFSEEQTALAERMAEEFGLVRSGGSDFHGSNKPDISIGTGRGNLAVPLESLEELKKRIR